MTVEYETDSKPSRRERRAAKRAQHNLIEGEKDNRARNRLIGLVLILGFLVILSICFNWFVSGVRQEAYREGQNDPNEQIIQKICAEAYTIGVDGRTEPSAVAGTRENDLSVSGQYCNFSVLPVPPTTKPASK